MKQKITTWLISTPLCLISFFLIPKIWIKLSLSLIYFFFQAEYGIRDIGVTGVQTCALPICYRGGHLQVFTKDLGRRAHVVSKRGRRAGNGDSRNPVIGNSGYYIAFQSDATNLSTDAARRARDYNGRTDTYLYTNVRNMTIAQSVFEKGVTLPGGGFNPSMSFYANYIVFDSPGGSTTRDHQVYLRYLGPV